MDNAITHEMTKTHDLLIIGAGPAGLSAADAAAREGLSYLVIEKGTIANTIRQYPVGRTLFSTPNELEMRAGTLHPVREKPTREELLSHYIHFVLDRDLKINQDEEVIGIQQNGAEGFIVHTRRETETDDAQLTYNASRLLFAIGAMDHARRLNVPGEDLPKVHHRFIEPYPYVRKEALVVGGGNSAAEAALFLSEEGARTTMAIWREDWENRDPKAGAMKHWVRTPLEREITEGRLRVILYKHVDEITTHEVTLTTETGEKRTIPNEDDPERGSLCAGWQRCRSDFAETVRSENCTWQADRNSSLRSRNFRNEYLWSLCRRPLHQCAAHKSRH